MTDQILEIADATTRIDLLRGIVRIEEDGYSPAIAGPRRSELGNVGPWADVEEEFQLEVVTNLSDNPGAVWSALVRLLDQAARRTAGDLSAQPVVLKARPAGSRLAAGRFFAAEVTGGEVPRLAASFMRLLDGGAVPAAPVTITRRGPWVAALPTAFGSTFPPADVTSTDEQVTTVTGGGSTFPNASQEIITLTWPSSHATLSPVEIAIAVPSSFTFANFSVAALLTAPRSTDFNILNADTLSPGGQYSSNAGMNARNTNYLRFLPTGSAVAGTNAATIIGAPREFTIYLIAQAIGGPIEVYAEYYLLSGLGTSTGLTTGVVTIPASSAPQLISLGTAASPNGPNRLKLWCRSPNGTTGSPELRIDTIITQAHEGGPTYAVAMEHGGVTLADQTPLTIRQPPIGRPTFLSEPLAYTESALVPLDGTPFSLPPSTGDLAIHSQGSSMSVVAVLLGTGTFRADTAAGIGIGITARRYPLYLSLE